MVRVYIIHFSRQNNPDEVRRAGCSEHQETTTPLIIFARLDGFAAERVKWIGLEKESVLFLYIRMLGNPYQNWYLNPTVVCSF